MTASIRSSFEEARADLPSSPPRNSTPCGMTVATMPPVAEDGQHVLDEHQVGLLARLGAEAVAEALGERDAVACCSSWLERRIGDHAVEAHAARHPRCARVCEGVVVVGGRHRGCRAAACSSWRWPRRRRCSPGRRAEVLRVAAVLLDVLLGEDEHAARARARVVDAHALVRLGDAHHQAHDRGACRTRRPSCRRSRRSRAIRYS